MSKVGLDYYALATPYNHEVSIKQPPGKKLLVSKYLKLTNRMEAIIYTTETHFI